MIKVIIHARAGYAEVVYHTGRHACKYGGEDYTDNSRTSKVCPAHRAAYKRAQAAQRGKRRAKKAA